MPVLNKISNYLTLQPSAPQYVFPSASASPMSFKNSRTTATGRGILSQSLKESSKPFKNLIKPYKAPIKRILNPWS